MTLPNFVIAGAARSGTTSLYFYLKQHPEIGFPNKKEPKYFSSLHLDYPHNGPGDDTVDAAMVRDFRTYQSLYNGLSGFSAIGDASSDYLYYHKHSAPAIKKALGDIPIILILRNPVERTISAYNNMLKDHRETLSLEDALAVEEERIANNWDWMWAYRSGGLYYNQVEMYMKTFSRVHVILFDDLAADPQMILCDTYRFLGVNGGFVADISSKYSPSGKSDNPLFKFFSRRDNPLAFAIRTFIIKIAPRSFIESILQRLLKKDDISESIRRSLLECFLSDIIKLETLIGKDLSKWKLL